MVREYRLYLDDIIEAVRRIKEFTNKERKRRDGGTEEEEGRP